jgi:hypothetical protein
MLSFWTMRTASSLLIGRLADLTALLLSYCDVDRHQALPQDVRT